MTIDIKQLLGNSLNTRDEAQQLFKSLAGRTDGKLPVTLNFEGVTFMSRSFAEGFHQLKTTWEKENPHAAIAICNADVQILQILQAVAKPKTAKKSKFTIVQQLLDLIQSV